MHSFSFVTEIPGRVQTFKELQKEFFWFPQFPFGHFVFIFRSEIFASTLFLFFLRCSLSSTGAHLLLLLGLLAGQSIKFFCCAHAAAFACADKMEASIGHINMQGPQTQKKASKETAKIEDIYIARCKRRGSTKKLV